MTNVAWYAFWLTVNSALAGWSLTNGPLWLTVWSSVSVCVCFWYVLRRMDEALVNGRG